MANTKGSEWNRWDLHFHSQTSHDYGDRSVSDVDIIQGLKRGNIRVVAITDHHVIDVERIQALQKLGSECEISVLPGIEFLSDARGKDPIHFIGIFSEDCNLPHVWAQLENRTEIRKVKGEGKKCDEVYCDLIETIRIVKELGGLVSIHAGAKSGSLENITHSLPHGAAQKADIAAAVDMYELGKTSDASGYREFVFPAINRVIPMVICSDNHNIRKYALKDSLWIKCTPNFAGLRYALSEPEERFFIGAEPRVLSRIRENPTKYLKAINIKLTGQHDPAGKWFEDVRIPLNGELVTIIGNKGGGKSAVADILALCADGDHSDDYLFLHKTKFKKRGLADRFSATLEFESGVSTIPRLLSHVVDAAEQSKVRYLPQSYFEKLCNEIGKTEAFRIEIEKVVFQYISRDKRLGKATFKELVDYKKTAAVEQINLYSNQIAEINSIIIALEDKSAVEYGANLLSRQKMKAAELDAHVSARPPNRVDPSIESDDAVLLAEKDKLQTWQTRRTALEAEIVSIGKRLDELSITLSNLSRVKAEIETKATEGNSFVELKRPELAKLGINIDDVLTINFEEKYLLKASDKLQNDISLLKGNLVGSSVPGSAYDELTTPRAKLDRCLSEILRIQEKFSGEQKEYQDHLGLLRLWEAKHAEIIGDDHTPDTLKFLAREAKFIADELPNELIRTRSQRKIISINIFKKNLEIKSFYDEIKSEIDSVFLAANVSGLNIASTLGKSTEFEERFLGFIQQNKSSSFYGSDGKTVLQSDVIGQTNWNKESDVGEFLDNVVAYLETDMRPGVKNGINFVGNFVKNRTDFYNFIFSLPYIESHYDLQQGGKNLDQLSPGEKGALLLIFYLVLDKEDIPLIIDQPEDNLDNFSVARLLVPYIKSAKKKRQIIIVTHNANLAVVADSEQVIKVDIDKNDGNKFRCLSGGIEDGIINAAVVEVLEGTVEAFQNRKEKYR